MPVTSRTTSRATTIVPVWYEGCAKRLALHIRHRKPAQSSGITCREERHNIGMLESSREVDLALESLHRYAADHLGRQDLQDDLAVQRRFGGQDYARHSATAEFALDSVRVS